jgi:hypothetical protein
MANERLRHGFVPTKVHANNKEAMAMIALALQ